MQVSAADFSWCHSYGIKKCKHLLYIISSCVSAHFFNEFFDHEAGGVVCRVSSIQYHFLSPGGAFGGKETRPGVHALPVAVAAVK